MVEVRCSKLDRYMKCAGFAHFTDLVEEEAGLPAQEGTAAGELLQAMVEQRTFKPNVATHAANGIRFDEDMWFFVTAVAERIFATAGDAPMTCEQRIDWEAVAGDVMVRGQYDVSFAVGDTCYLDDLKYGWNIVEAKDNWQLLGYAVGIMLKDAELKFKKYVLRIHQPRPNHEEGWTREWTLTREELYNFYTQITSRLGAIFSGDKTLSSGQHCKYCPALEKCPAFNRTFFAGVDHVLADFSQDSMSNRTLAYQLKVFGRIEEIFKIKKSSLEQLAVSRIQQGQVIEGYVTEASYGDRKWKPFVTPEVIESLTGKNIVKKEMMSPAQAEKMGVSKDLVKGITDRYFLKNKLVAKDAGALADKIFNKKEG